MKRSRITLSVLLTFATLSDISAQAKTPCFAFLLRADVNTVCEGRKDRITRRGDIDGFAISDERSSLGYVTTRITKRTAIAANAVSTTTVIDLNSRTAKQLTGENSLVSTCGGIFWTYDPRRESSGTRDLITGDEIAFPPYDWLRCSADRRTVVGTMKRSGSDLFEGLPPQVRVAMAGTYSVFTYNMSPDGSKIAYFRDTQPLCEFSSSSPAKCADGLATITDTPSVNDSGEVLVAADTPEYCLYKSMSNFSPAPPRAANDVCVGIGYWKPGLISIRIIEPLGRAPQWITPATAKLLRAWAASKAVGARK